VTTWLAPVAAALDRRSTAMRIFFRDDDAGWDRPRLMTLLDLFEAYDTPIDLAVIPDALDLELATELVARRENCPRLLGLHQHGFRHLNHELDGRKCEFGINRSFAEQALDLIAGRRRLVELLGEENLDMIFTPPWNRCTQTTVECLVKQGFRCLSRDATAAPLDTESISALPVHVDWCKAKGPIAQQRAMRGDWLTNAFERNATVGIMLHHATMGNEDFTGLEQLLTLLKKNGEPPCYLMSQLIEEVETALAN
jgi:hypothetical protein